MELEKSKLGNYYLLSLIGRGGMGAVYLAEDTRLRSRKLAIKVIQAEVSQGKASEVEELARTFGREIETVATLKHENILPLYDFGVETISRTILGYIVMPYCQEGTFEDWLAKHKGPLPLQDVVYFVVQTANTLQYVHDQQIIHRDIKPPNFLIQGNRENSNHPRLVLADFGLAKFTAIASRSLRISGTPIYMAPEQWNGKAVFASDQYALAIIAYELLTGRPPFVGSTLEEVINQHFRVLPDPPSKYNPHFPRGLDNVVLRALKKDPQNRFASISAFADAFQQAAEPDTLGRNLAIGGAVAGVTLGALLARNWLKGRKEKQLAERNPVQGVFPPGKEPKVLPAKLFSQTLDSLGERFITDCIGEAHERMNRDQYWIRTLKNWFAAAAIGYVHQVQNTAQGVAAQLKPGVKVPGFRPGEPVASPKEGMYGAVADRPANVASWIATLLAQPLGPDNNPLDAELNGWMSKVVYAKNPRQETLELIRRVAEKLLPSLKAEAVKYLLEIDRLLSAS